MKRDYLGYEYFVNKVWGYSDALGRKMIIWDDPFFVNKALGTNSTLIQPGFDQC